MIPKAFKLGEWKSHLPITEPNIGCGNQMSALNVGERTAIHHNFCLNTEELEA